MGGQKATTENEYKFFQKPGWAELDALKGWNPEADPTIGANFGRQKNDLERSFVAPTGSYMTPELREQQMRSGIQEIGQNEATARRVDQYDQNKMKLGQLGQAAGLAQPEFAQTKGTQKQGGGWGSILQGALQAGAAFL